MLIGGATLALAHGPGPFNEIIHACVQDTGGNIKVGEDCKNNWSPLDWNGGIGPKGDIGPAGLSGHEVIRVNEDATLAANGGFFFITITCPDGKKILGGGAGNSAWTNGFGVIPVLSMPSPNTSTWNTSETTWTVGFSNIDSVPHTLNLAAYAICATVAP